MPVIQAYALYLTKVICILFCMVYILKSYQRRHWFLWFLCTALYNPKHLDVFDGCECVAVCVYCSAAHNGRALPL